MVTISPDSVQPNESQLLSRGKNIFKRPVAAWCRLAALLCLLASLNARAVVFDGGVDPANLGKGEWIYIVANAANGLNGYVPSVTDVPSLMAYLKGTLKLQYIVVKAGDNGTPYPSSGSQFTASLVNAAHDQNLKIFGYTRCYGTSVSSIPSLVSNVFNCGADGFILDAEDEWVTNLGSGAAATAWWLCGTIKTNWPTKFLAHSPICNISGHSSFPYREFGYWCDAVMPQVYWVAWGKANRTWKDPLTQQYYYQVCTPAAAIGLMDAEWRNFQNSLSGLTSLGTSWTNAIKPLVPIGQADSPGATNWTGALNQTFADMTNFVWGLKTDSAAVTAGGYKGCCFFAIGESSGYGQDLGMLAGIADSSIGDVPAPPVIVTNPVSQTGLVGSNVIFRVSATGSAPLHYQWKRNSTDLNDGGNVAGAHSQSLTLSDLSFADVAAYSVVITNSLGTATSAEATLTLGHRVIGIHSFPEMEGLCPALVPDPNGGFWGATFAGGASSNGQVFHLTLSGSLTTVAEFAGTNGAGPNSLRLASDGNLYGTTIYGGTAGNGSVFKVSPAGSLATVCHFDGDHGALPNSLCQGQDGNFYGTTLTGGTYGSGVVFKVTPDGILTALVDFNFDNGAAPVSLIAGSDGNLYGITQDGGAAAYGTVFKVTPAGVFTTLVNFTEYNGSYPDGPLIEAVNGVFYGTTRYGGFYGSGTIFRVTSAGEFTSVYSSGQFGEVMPEGSLLRRPNGNLYWGSSTGTILQLTPSGAVTLLTTVTGITAFRPGLLTLGSDGSLYGAARSGGQNVIFSVSDFVPSVLNSPASRTELEDSVSVFTVQVDGSAPLRFQWQRNGTSLSDGPNVLGATNNTLILNHITPADAGVYSVSVMNSAGIAVSSNAVLVVVPRSRFGFPILSNSQFCFSLTGGAAGEYTIETSTNLLDWIAATNLIATNGASEFHDSTPDPQRFYRAVKAAK